MCLHQALFHTQAERLVLAHCFEKLLHQFIALVFEQLVAAAGGIQAFFEPCQLHAGRVYVEPCQKNTSLTFRASISR